MVPEHHRSNTSWWVHVPVHQRFQRRLGVWCFRWREVLLRRPFLITTLFIAYAVICFVILLSSTGGVALLATLPLLLVPPVGALAYWLLWNEFHY